MSIYTVDKILVKLPAKTLPLLHGEPTYEAINDMMQRMYGNVATINTPLGGSSHWYLELIMKETLYATLLEMPFIVPQDPGPLPVCNPNQTYTAVTRDTVV